MSAALLKLAGLVLSWHGEDTSADWGRWRAVDRQSALVEAGLMEPFAPTAERMSDCGPACVCIQHSPPPPLCYAITNDGHEALNTLIAMPEDVQLAAAILRTDPEACAAFVAELEARPHE